MESKFLDIDRGWVFCLLGLLLRSNWNSFNFLVLWVLGRNIKVSSIKGFGLKGLVERGMREEGGVRKKGRRLNLGSLFCKRFFVCESLKFNYNFNFE